MQPPSSDAKIVAELLDMENVSSDNDDAIKTEDESLYCPDRNELLENYRDHTNHPYFQKVVQLFSL